MNSILFSVKMSFYFCFNGSTMRATRLSGFCAAGEARWSRIRQTGQIWAKKNPDPAARTNF